MISRLKKEGQVDHITKKSQQWEVPLQTLPRTYGCRLLVIGDAARQVKPPTGGGIYYSLLAWSLASKTLDAALSNNNLSKTQLKTYERGWRKLLNYDMKVGHWARRLFESISDNQMDTLIETIAKNGLRKDILYHKDFSLD